MKKDIQISIRIPAQLRDKLKEEADAEHRSLAGYIAIVLQEHMTKLSQPTKRRG